MLEEKVFGDEVKGQRAEDMEDGGGRCMERRPEAHCQSLGYKASNQEKGGHGLRCGLNLRECRENG